MSRDERLVPLGVVAAAHGVRGEVRVKLWNPDSELFAELDEVFASGPSAAPRRTLHIEGLRPHNKGPIVSFAGVRDRAAAEAMRGAELSVPRSMLPMPAPGEFYLFDLAGLEARRPDGTRLGRVRSVLSYPASDVACVETEAGLLEVPLLSPYLVEVRLDDGVIVVDELEDLEPQPASEGGR